MILHMRHTLWTGISETNVNFITPATRIHAFNNNNDIMNSPNGSKLVIPKKILKILWVVDYKYQGYATL